MASRAQTRTRTARRTPSRSPVKRFVKKIFAWSVLGLLVLMIPLIATFLIITRDVQSEMSTIEDRLTVGMNRPTVLVAADGSDLLRIASEYRKPFELKDVPDHVIDAFIAAEDRRFWEHSGVDPIGLVRAAFISAKERRVSQGGSTIPMQLAKRLFNGEDKTAQRKVRDIVLAMELEKRKTKRQLLELYLQQVYFGEQAFGLASAAEIYFGKDIKQLTIGEAAMLARCVRRPSDENPVQNYRKAIQNRNVVLALLREDGKITKAQHDQAVKERPVIKTSAFKRLITKSRAPYFVDHVLRVVRDEFPDIKLEEGGYRIETTLRPDLQGFADRSVRQVVRENRRNRVGDGAFMLMDRNGEILVEVGGQDYRKSEVNFVTSGFRQPGSAFKPFVYSAALALGSIRPDQAVSNAPIHIPIGNGKTYSPQNSARWETAGSYSLSTAIAASINRPALHVYYDTGRERTVQFIQDTFGVTSRLEPEYSLALGAREMRMIELAQAYSVFMLEGDRVRPFPIRRIIAPDGTVLRDYSAQVTPRVMEPWVAQTMNRYLRDVVTSGTARAAGAVPDAVGKTGTTNDHADAWFVGHADGLLGVAWVGNKKSRTPMTGNVFGGTVSVQFWRDVMNYAREHVTTRTKIPKNVQVKASEERRRSRRERPRQVSVEPSPAEEETPVAQIQEKTDVAPVEGTDAKADEERAAARDREREERRDRERREREQREEERRDRERREREERDERRREAEAETVSVEICAETGKRASRYCPATLTRTYPKGRAPKGRCTLHHG